VLSRYERSSVIVICNKPVRPLGKVLGDPAVTTAMIDRLVHHAEVVSLKGASSSVPIREAWLFDSDSMPRVCTRPSARRVLTPRTWHSATARRARARPRQARLEWSDRGLVSLSRDQCPLPAGPADDPYGTD
jgi:hypothetical protein